MKRFGEGLIQELTDDYERRVIRIHDFQPLSFFDFAFGILYAVDQAEIELLQQLLELPPWRKLPTCAALSLPTPGL